MVVFGAVSIVHARIQMVLSEGVQLCNSDNVFLYLFLVDNGREDPNAIKDGPSRACRDFTWNFL